MADVYDIVGAFQDIEMDLIKSMKKNMKRHIGEELQEDISWTQWQAEMLNGLAQYKAENADKLKGCLEVRMAEEGEKLTTLDNIERTLNNNRSTCLLFQEHL